MPRAQITNFKTIPELLECLPPLEREITEELRLLILDCVPRVKEKISFQALFFSYRSSICFLWPGSIDWMGKSTPGKVQLGFSRGHLLTDRHQYMTLGTRKVMTTRNFFSLEEINHEIIAELLYEAVEINDLHWDSKRIRVTE
jgi:Domain of unknown function (DU1801)